MDLRLTPEMEAFREEVRAFLAAHRDHYAGDAGARPREAALQWQRLLIENGYAARTIPKAYGGYGAEPDILKTRIIAEEFTRAGAPRGFANQGISMLVPTLLRSARKSKRSDGSARPCAARSSGARAIPNLAPARTWPPSRPRRSRTATIS